LAEAITGLRFVVLHFDDHHFNGVITHIKIPVMALGGFAGNLGFSSFPEVRFGCARLLLYLHCSTWQSNDHPTVVVAMHC